MTVGSSPQSSGSMSEADALVDQRWQGELLQTEALLASGNKLMEAEDWEASAAKYEEGIMHVLRSSNFLPVALLSNISAAALMQNDLDTALFYAGVVAGLPHTPLSAKAYYRTVAAARCPMGAMWPVALIHIHKCISQLSSGSQHIITAKAAELDNQGTLRVPTKEIVAGGFKGELSCGVQLIFGKELSESAVHVLHNLPDTPVTDSSNLAVLGRSFAHILHLKQAGDDAVCNKAYADAIAKYRDALSSFPVLSDLLVRCSAVNRQCVKIGPRINTLMPLAALSIIPRGELQLVFAAAGAPSHFHVVSLH